MNQTTPTKPKLDLISTVEAAKMLGYKNANSFRTMYYRTRPFPVYRMSTSHCMYNREDIEKYIESKRVDGVDMFTL